MPHIPGSSSEVASASGQGTPVLSLAVLGEAVGMAVQWLFPKRDELQERVGFLSIGGGSLGRNSK